MLATSAQIQAVRAVPRPGQEEPARAANLPVETVRRRPERRGGRTSDAGTGTLDDLAAAFAARGVEFVNGERAGVAVAAASLEGMT